jgi:hypothetical protein
MVELCERGGARLVLVFTYAACEGDLVYSLVVLFGG